MSNHTEKMAVMFADICGSTSLYERLGDVLARQLISKCLALLVTNMSEHNGTLIKTIGDEIMCSFPSSENAMNAACAMQNSVENDSSETDHPMHIRIGFHFGDVISEAGDIYGDTVNVAARVASITRAAQILTTRAAATSLPLELRSQVHQIMRAELKGKQEQHDIFRVEWEADDGMSTRIGTPTFRKPQEGDDELTLRHLEQSFKINQHHPRMVIGRGDACDILVESDFASRQHAQIELRFGKFVIVDQSTNGTYVRFSDGHTVRLSREDLVLRGTGSIILGQAQSDKQSDIVDFSIGSTSA